MSARSRRILIPAAASVILAAAALLLFAGPLLPHLQLRAMRLAVSTVTGQPCRVGSFSSGERIAHDVEIGPAGQPLVRLDSVRLVPAEARRPEDLHIDGLYLDLPGWPAAAMPGLRLRLGELGPLAGSGLGEMSMTAQGELVELNSLLVPRARVRAERGRFELAGRPRLGPGKSISGEVRITFRNFLLRGIDGNFEAQASSATARIRLGGTLDAPQLDIGELEPYLGRDFVRSFGAIGR
jgi:hypothetical protein